MKNLLALLSITSLLILSSCDYFCDCDCDDNNPVDTDEELSFDDLYVYYNFDSNSQDQSDNNLDCEPVGKYSYLSGVKGNSIFLDNPRNETFAHDAYVNLPEFNYNNDFTISFYMKYNFSSAEGAPDATYIWTAGAQVMSGNNRGYQYQLGLRTTVRTHDRLYLFAGNSNEDGFSSSSNLRPNIDDNNWHHIVIRKESNMIDYFFDNQIIERILIPNEFNLDNYHEAYLGKHLWIQSGIIKKATRYNGLIDEFFLFDRAIEDEEITQLFELEY